MGRVLVVHGQQLVFPGLDDAAAVQFVQDFESRWCGPPGCWSGEVFLNGSHWLAVMG